MVSKNPNLLEAFQTATHSSSDKGKSIGGPFVPHAPDDGDERGGDRGGDQPDGLRSNQLPNGLLPFVLALVLFAGGVLVGRWTATPAIAGEHAETIPAGSILPETTTADTTPPAPRNRPPLASPGQAAATEPARRAFGDPNSPRAKLLAPANRFTAIAVTYAEGDEGLAQATAGYLAAKGFEAVAVRERGGLPLVLVGAAPERDSIDRLCERLKVTRDARGALDFDSAYTVNIDDYIDR